MCVSVKILNTEKYFCFKSKYEPIFDDKDDSYFKYLFTIDIIY